MSRRVLLWVQHLLGVGHVARAHAIARGLVDAGLELTVVLGGEPVPAFPFDGASVVQLPPIRAADLTFSRLLDERGAPVSADLLAMRRDLLLALGSRFKPHVLVTEHFPFGRRKLQSELLPLIAALKPGARIVASLRDVLVEKDDPSRARKVVGLVNSHFDRVLVHGDRALIPLEATFPDAKAIADRISYTGYVAAGRGAGPEPPGNEGRGEVIVSVGGGAVGQDLMLSALEARRNGLLSDRRWRFLCGANLGGAFIAELRAAAPADVIVEPARADFRGLLARASLSISQAGYNTLMDLLVTSCRSVVVPFAGGTESEQTYRARLLAAKGLVHVVDERGLEPRALAAAALAASAAPPPATRGIDLDGVGTTARLVKKLAEEAARGRL
jgi:predicted glycosyltransferase